MNRFQDKQPPVIDPNSPENIEKRNSIMDYLKSNEMVQKPQPIDLKDYGVMQPTVMNNFQPFQAELQGYERGGNVQYLKGGGPTMPSGKYSYSKTLKLYYHNQYHKYGNIHCQKKIDILSFIMQYFITF